MAKKQKTEAAGEVPVPPPDARDGGGEEPIHRIGIGLNVALQVVLVLTLFGVVNYLSYRHYQRWDLTPERSYTLSDASKKVLKTLRDDVTVTVAFVRGSKISEDVLALVDEYDRSRKTRVVVNYVDPVRNPAEAEDVKNKFGIELDKNLVIVSSGESTKVIGEEEMIVRETVEGGGESRITGFRGEEALTAALLSVTEKERQKVYYLAGKGKVRVSDYGSAYKVFEDIGRKQNLSVEPLVLPSIQELPEDTRGIILHGPKYDLSEREMEVIKNYWDARRGSMLILLSPGSETPRLNAFLRENGVDPQNDRVLWAKTTAISGFKKRYDVQSYFLSDSPITQPYFGTTTAFGGQTKSLKFLYSDDELLQRGLQVNPLLQAAEDYWGEKNYFEEEPKPDAGDNLPPVHVAASVERGGVDDPALRVESARMVVVGNSSLLDPDTQDGASYDFATASINWLLDRAALIGIPAKRKESFRPNIAPDQQSRLFLIACILLPSAVLAFGLFNWSVRRAS